MFDISYKENTDYENNDLTTEEIKSVLKLIWAIQEASNTPVAALGSLLISIAASISANMGNNINPDQKEGAIKFFEHLRKETSNQMEKAFYEYFPKPKKERKNA